MANSRKHSKNPMVEWLEAEESPAPTHSRSARTLSAYVKLAKSPSGKSRRLPPPEPSPKPEPALAREAGGEVKLGGHQSQPASFDHLLKMQRLSNLRAPYGYKPPAPPAPAGPKPKTSSRARAASVKK